MQKLGSTIFIIIAGIALFASTASAQNVGLLPQWRAGNINTDFIYPRVSSATVVIGGTATTTASDKLQVIGNASISGLSGSGVRCLQTNNSGTLAVAAAACGTGGAVTWLANGGAFFTSSTVNFAAGANMTLTTSTDGTYTFAATAGSGLTSLNGLTTSTQTFATSSSGTDFDITSSGNVHTFAIPSASLTARGLVTTGSQNFLGQKILNFAGTGTGEILNFRNAIFGEFGKIGFARTPDIFYLRTTSPGNVSIILGSNDGTALTVNTNNTVDFATSTSVAGLLTASNGLTGTSTLLWGGNANTSGTLTVGGTPVVLNTRAITIAGTANEITSSAGAQDLSADRTWTLSLPSTVDLGASSVFTTVGLNFTNATGTTLNVATTTITNLTASRLVASDGSKNLVSVGNLASWIAGTASEITVGDDGDGSVTLSLPSTVDLGAASIFTTVGANFTNATTSGNLNVATLNGAAFSPCGSTSTLASVYNSSTKTFDCVALSASGVSNFTAGRSLTTDAATGAITVDADAELYTKRPSVVIQKPTSTAGLNVVHVFKAPVARTLSHISCSVNNATATIQLDRRAEGSENSFGTMVSTSTVCGTAFTSSTAFATTSFAANTYLVLTVSSTAGTNGTTTLSFWPKYTNDD